MATIEEIKRDLLSKTKGDIVSVMGNNKSKDWLVSPALDLNRILSGSLYKSVQVSNHTALIGPETSGKSSLMALLLADAQKKGYLPVVINAEGAWTNEFCERWGLDPDNIVLINSLWVDEITPKLAEFVENKFENLAIAVDSIGALELRKMVDDGMKGDVKADQGRLQKDIKRMLKMIVGLCKFQNCIAFSAGHYYGSPTAGYGSPEQIGGGKYYRLSADVMVSLKKTPIYQFPNEKTIANKGKIIGNKITGATLKNRAYPPFQEATVEIDYLKGVNEFAGLMDVAIDIGIIKQSGSWYICDILDIKTQGQEKFWEEFENSDKQKFIDAIEVQLKKTGYSTVNRSLEFEEVEKEESQEVSQEKLNENDVDETVKTSNVKKKPGRPKKS